MSVSGSGRGVTIDGIQYRVTADNDMTGKFSSFENENLPTSGESISKKTIVSPNLEGIELAVSADEIESLKESAAKSTDYSLSYNAADGTEWKAQGKINLGDYSSADGKAEVTLMPNNALKGWQKF